MSQECSVPLGPSGATLVLSSRKPTGGPAKKLQLLHFSIVVSQQSQCSIRGELSGCCRVFVTLVITKKVFKCGDLDVEETNWSDTCWIIAVSSQFSNTVRSSYNSQDEHVITSSVFYLLYGCINSHLVNTNKTVLWHCQSSKWFSNNFPFCPSYRKRGIK